MKKIEIDGWKYNLSDPEIGFVKNQGYKIITGKNYYCALDENLRLIYFKNEGFNLQFCVQSALINEKLQTAEGRDLITINFGAIASKNNTLAIKTKLKNKICNDIFFINSAAAIKNGFIESFLDGIFYEKNEIYDLSSIKKINNVKHFNFKDKYNVSDYKKDYLKQIEEASNDVKFKNNFDLLKFYRKYLKDFSFGVELEFSNGYIRPEDCFLNNFVGLRDGSVAETGSELASLPIFDYRGIHKVKNMMEILETRTSVDHTCSTHIHVGNLRTDNLFISNIYKVLLSLQNELYQAFPQTRNQEVNGKRYCAPLPKLDLTLNRGNLKSGLTKNVEKIFASSNGGRGYEKAHSSLELRQVENGLFKKVLRETYYCKKSNISVYDGIPKYNIPARYFIVNFFNFLLKPVKTMEFRIMEGTSSFNAFINWVSLIVAIIKYAEKLHPMKNIDGLTLKTVISDYFETKEASKLITYWEKRKEIFKVDIKNSKLLNDFKIY